ncbi:hypothetical protein pb186bvf_016000 [Paramecium bursaria]
MILTQEIKNQLTKAHNLDAVVLPLKQIGPFTRNFKQYIFAQQRWQKEDENSKSICINIKQPYPEDLQKYIDDNGLKIIQKDITIKYEDLSYNEVLEQLIPVQAPQGFETIEKIAHFNLGPEHLPYKFLIGQVLLDKNRNLRTVCNKTQKLDNVFRTPVLELLAGENNYEALINEGKVKLQLNFQEVYWNTRLYSERERILKLIQSLKQPQPIKILDLFCGIGPCAIRAAKEIGAICLANDLNPHGVKYMKINIQANKVQNQVTPLNMDAREVVLKIYSKEINFHFDHVYMNLPVLAINFLDVFRGFTKQTGRLDLPFIHVYGFAKGLAEEDLLQEVEKRIKLCLPGFDRTQILKFHILKNVTKMKKMVVISFQLDKLSAESDFYLNDPKDQQIDSDDDEIQEEIVDQQVKKIKQQ